MNTQNFIPQVANTAVVTAIDLGIARSLVAKLVLTMLRNNAVPSDDSDLQSTIADDTSETCVINLRPFILLAASVAHIFENAERRVGRELD